MPPETSAGRYSVRSNEIVLSDWDRGDWDRAVFANIEGDSLKLLLVGEYGKANEYDLVYGFERDTKPATARIGDGSK